MGRIMTIGEVAEKVQMAVSTLRKYVMRKEIPFKKVGVRVRFDEGEIDAWLAGKSFGLNSIKKKMAGKKVTPGELFSDETGEKKV
jgi:excisionase family DNA binding protein